MGRGKTDNLPENAGCQKNIIHAKHDYAADVLAEQKERREVTNYVGHLLSECSGVYDYTGLTLNGQAENLTVNETDIPIMGEVNLSESG